MTARAQLQAQPSEGERALATLILWAKLPAPEWQYRFDPVRKWRFDAAWPLAKLAVEVEGGTFVAGRHTRGKGYERDAEKYNAAVLAGWRVLRFTTDMVTDGRALVVLERAMPIESVLGELLGEPTPLVPPPVTIASGLLR